MSKGAPSSRRRWAPRALQFYRLAVLVAIFLLIRSHHTRLRLHGDQPITVAEVKTFLPEADRLVADDGPRQGFKVTGSQGQELGYVVRTSPHAKDVIGYSGPTDTLVVLDAEDKIAGLEIRHSYDTPNHVEDVANDYLFMESWNGKTWDEVATMDLAAAGVEGVSGATRTSMCLAESVVVRLGLSISNAAAKPPLRMGLNDLMLVLTLLGGLGFAFHWFPKKSRPNAAVLRKRLRRTFQIFVIVYIGFVQGDLLAQSLFRGWVESGIPWRFTPGLVLFAAAAFIVPWSTRKPLYCSQICPHGAAQEMLGKVLPKKFRIKLAPGVKSGLKAVPVMLLSVVLLMSLLVLPFDAAGIEPFDAYIFKSAGIATIAVAIGGLLFSLFVPMGYCHYGCPTGALLRFTRSHGGADHFRPGDAVAGVLLLITILIVYNYDKMIWWIYQSSSF